MSDSAPSVVLPLRAWLAASHLAILVLPVVVVLGTGALATDLRNQTRSNLENQASILRLHTQDRVRREARSDLAPLADDLTALLREVKAATYAGVRITDARGIVIASSGDGMGTDLSSDVEVREALAGRDVASVRPRDRPGHNQPLSSPSRRARVRLFVTTPIRDDEGVVLGTVVISRTPREELQALYNMAGLRLILGAMGAVLVTLAAAAFASVVLSRSLRRVDGGARRIAGGSFGGIQDLEGPTRSHVLEVARLADSVSSMAIRLQARLGYIGEFASNVSHEFKTPLATLKGTVELLDDDPDMPLEQRKRFLDNAQRELERLEALVEGLLTLARADAEPVRGDVDLDALVADVAGRRTLHVEGPFGHTDGDRAQLESVLCNLVDNALQHGGDGVTVSVRSAPSGVGFVVHDTGKGISEGNVERVFDRFFTTDRARGTGLGLALVRAIVERHGGRLSVRSTPGDTTFSVELPARE